MKVDYVLLGKRIRSLRKKHKLTQEQFAELIDRSFAFVGHIERGTRKPSVETLCEIAVKMNCSTAMKETIVSSSPASFAMILVLASKQRKYF